MDLNSLVTTLSILYGLTIEVVDNYSKKAFGSYDRYGKEITLSAYSGPAVLLHEAGHALNHWHGEDFCFDELLAWDTAKSVAVEIGYQWTQEDEESLHYAMESYDFRWVDNHWEADEASWELFAPMSK